MDELKKIIEEAYSSKEKLSSKQKEACLFVIENLDQGKMRVCEKVDGKWIVHEFIKKAILLYFRIEQMKVFSSGPFQFFDKIPLKKWSSKEGVRVVPQALVRKGAYVEKGSVLMPSYVNIGAYVGSGTLVDTWATVGSCAQIGRNIHLSGGVGIGGVLEPLQALPVILEDDVFVGSRSILVEGVHVGEGAVIGSGVSITSSTPIIDVTKKEAKQHKAYIPPRSVVIPGVRPKRFPSGTYETSCALIIGERKESTDKKTSLNEALRDFKVS